MRTYPYYIRSCQLLWGPKLNRAKNPWDRLFFLWLLIQYYDKEANLSLWVVREGFGWLKGGGRVLFSCHNSKTKARYLSTICEGTILCQEFRKVPFRKTLGGAFVVHSFCPEGRKFEQTNFQKFKCTGSCREDVDRCISRKISIKMIIVMMKTIIMMIIIIITEHGENLWFLIINLIVIGVNVTYHC